MNGHTQLSASCSCLSCVLLRLLCMKSDELCCGGRVLYDIFSLESPSTCSSSSSAISLSTYDNMIEPLSPTGKSAMRGAEMESWRTCMKMTHLQSVQIKHILYKQIKRKRKRSFLYVSLHLSLS